jgi:outer membrane protein OmpA-like peptidoglycan-associated protein
VQWTSPRPLAATPPRRRLGFLIPLAAAAVLAFIITLIVVRNRSNNNADGSAAPATTAAAAAPAPTTAGANGATTAAVAANATSATTASNNAAPTTTATAATTASTVPAPATTATASGAVTASGDEDVNLFTPVRWAVYSGGKVELLGNVPSKEIADDIAKRAAAVVGPENVTVSYIIDPTAPLPKSAPLYVRDLVLFDIDSAELKSSSNQLLDLGVVLMQNNPAVKIRVLGRADNRGDPAANIQLSLARAKSVINYVAARGIDPARLTPVALGSEAPVADNATDDGMAQNRSVSFVITGFVS